MIYFPSLLAGSSKSMSSLQFSDYIKYFHSINMVVLCSCRDIHLHATLSLGLFLTFQICISMLLPLHH